ncbi:hypothetical protein QJS66_16690 [Kocuria rhizophila]|nr:hypothetical protein QJS66_16690 [Kocuria rhizophila]
MAGPDASPALAASRAIERALSRSEWSAADLDLVEMTRRSPCVIVGLRRAGLWDKVERRGGAIALGRPMSASGARLALHAAVELAPRLRRGWSRCAVAAVRARPCC